MNNAKTMFINRVLPLIEAAQWKKAKTAKNNPHEYTLRYNWNDKEFCAFAELIRIYGHEVTFFRRRYIVLNINGYRYWTCGGALDKANGNLYTVVLNRTRSEYYNPYDKCADYYDTYYTGLDYQEQDLRVLYHTNPHGNILDVGCGTGLLLDYKKNEIPENKYLGIDPSRGMINVAQGKHPGYSFLNCSVRDFYTRKKYDTIVGLYGVGSYLFSSEIDKLKGMLAPGGQMYLMMFKPDYKPSLYKKSGIYIGPLEPIPAEEMYPYDQYLVYRVRG